METRASNLDLFMTGLVSLSLKKVAAGGLSEGSTAKLHEFLCVGQRQERSHTLNLQDGPAAEGSAAESPSKYDVRASVREAVWYKVGLPTHATTTIWLTYRRNYYIIWLNLPTHGPGRPG